MEHGLSGGHVADAPADGERDRRGAGYFFDYIQHGRSSFDRRGDIQKGQFIRPGMAVGDAAGNRITGIADVDELNALDDASVLHIETGHDSDGHRCFLPLRMGSIVS